MPIGNFQYALDLLKRGRPVTRLGWNGPGQHLQIQRVVPTSKMTLPYIYITTVQGDLVPWLASQTDILAEDWQEALVAQAQKEPLAVGDPHRFPSGVPGRTPPFPPSGEASLPEEERKPIETQGPGGDSIPLEAEKSDGGPVLPDVVDAPDGTSER